MKKEVKFLKLLFVFCVVLFIADRIDDYLLRRDVRTYMFSEGGLEYFGEYKCERLEWNDLEADRYLPAPGIFCRSKMISEVPFGSNSKHYYSSYQNGHNWTFHVKLNREMKRYWYDNYTNINFNWDWKGSGSRLKIIEE